jgi:integrase
MSTQNPNPPRMTAVKDEPGIYLLANGKYLIRFRDETGKVRDRRFPNLTLAKRAKGKIDGGEKRAENRQTFRAYAQHWLDTYTGRKAHGATDETVESYRDAIERLAIPFFGSMRLDRIDPPKVKAFIAHLEDQGYAPATIRRYFAPVRALFKTAFEDGMIGRDVNVRVVLRNPQERAPRRPLTADETAAILAEIPAKHADVALLYATTGARLQEPFAVRYSDLGRDNEGCPTIRFPRSKTPAGLKPIRLTPEMAQALTRRRAETGAGPDDLVFPSATGTEMSGRNWRRRVFKPAAERAGVPEATPHQLRHGVATLMAKTGATASDIGRMLRHADGGRLAMQTYIDSDAPDVTFLDDVFRAARAHNSTTGDTTSPQTSANGQQTR